MEPVRLDPRYVLLYTLTDVARCVRVKPATLRDWGVGRDYATAGARRRVTPVSILADPIRPDRFSFMNLVA
jgi:hypothetical protein